MKKHTRTMKQNLCCLLSKIDSNFEKSYFMGYDKDDDEDIYIMMKCVCVCHEKSSLPPGSFL